MGHLAQELVWLLPVEKGRMTLGSWSDTTSTLRSNTPAVSQLVVTGVLWQ